MLPAGAFAQTAGTAAAAAGVTAAQATPTPTEAEAQLAEIVVTAEKRDVSLQDASLSVSAVPAQALTEANVTEITGLNGLVPGLVVARSGGGERMISIRGVGSETPENTNTQPGVSYHIDGVYIFNSIAANAAFIDVAQVEVLRGPQGTTFGQGSTGGTINVVTNRPSLDALTGSMDLSAGNYDFIKAGAALNVPISSTLAVRGAVQHNSHDGYAYATGVPGFSKYQLDNQDETGWKAALLWEPASNFSITLNTVQYRSNNNGPAQKNVLDPSTDPRILTQDYAGKSIVNTELYYGVVKYDAGFATLKSITSYQTLFSTQAWDSDGLTTDLFYDATYNPKSFTGVYYDHTPLWRTNTKSWTQEFNLSSNSSGPFKWIVGGVYLHSKNSQYIVEYRSGANQDILQPAISENTPYDSPAVDNVTYAELSSITRKAWAGYVEASYDFTDALKVTGGVRYNDDRFSGTSDSMSGGASEQTSGAYLQPAATEGLSTGRWTGKAAIQYKLTPANMAYFSFTRGFKPGGINSSAAGGNSSYLALGWENGVKPTYQPEQLDSFEVGLKNRFLNNRAQLNLSAFIYNYKNMQFLEEDPILFGEGISNAPSARIYGAEVEGSWLATPTVTLDGSFSLLRGTFNKDYYALDPVNASRAQNAAGYPDYLFWTNFYAASVAREGARANINGNDVPKLPKFQGTAAITYANQVGPGKLTAKAQIIYRGEYQYRLFNDPGFDKTPSYAQVNLFLKYAPDSTNLWGSLTVTNLFDKAGVNSRFSDPYGSAQTYDTYIPPRQVFGTIGYRF
ncbi:TonB-dependent receptor [Sphingomonas hengshuiensis]|uniref:TonB-dependent receptor n=2 Tax=Sphingomonas hengshuiensis TaxID=1609977 RepID=A0A7U5BFI2_9SPHN|nr:TonB-dependent receptor [Sphingomonas hengshuiensis]